MEIEEKIQKLEDFKHKVLQWKKTYNSDLRSEINQNRVWIRREVIEAG